MTYVIVFILKTRLEMTEPGVYCTSMNIFAISSVRKIAQREITYPKFSQYRLNKLSSMEVLLLLYGSFTTLPTAEHLLANK